MENEVKHKRRVRYKGTHPRKFSEKYKELNPEKYGDEVQKIISKGNTPAGMHISIMVNEILDVLRIQPGQQGLDATLGYGGHTRAMLQKLEGRGHLYGLDVDTIEIEKTKKRLRDAGFGEDIFTAVNINFANIDQVAAQYGKFDFVLADLGVSSMQIDNPERGFTFKYDGPLDLRLDPSKGITAAERLKQVSQPELQGMLIENADEPYALQISRAIISKIKKGQPVETTMQLRSVIEEALAYLPAATRKEAVKKSCQRTFQALRIDINNEYEVLYDFLNKLPDILNPGARVAILTFHSGEDRLVKKAFQSYFRGGIFSDIAKDVIRPSAAECGQNPRARSTKLRWAVMG